LVFLISKLEKFKLLACLLPIMVADGAEETSKFRRGMWMYRKQTKLSENQTIPRWEELFVYYEQSPLEEVIETFPSQLYSDEVAKQLNRSGFLVLERRLESFEPGYLFVLVSDKTEDKRDVRGLIFYGVVLDKDMPYKTLGLKSPE